jgi:hypothetical protein
MNYIKHLTIAFEKMDGLPDCSPFHISLYIALFRFWNQNRFVNPLSVYRTDLMKAAKIGSVNTYGKCLKQLDAWKLIRYFPSQNIYQLSQFHVFAFDGEAVSQAGVVNDTQGISNEQILDTPPYLNNEHGGDEQVSGLSKQEETFDNQTRVAPAKKNDKKVSAEKNKGLAEPKEFVPPEEAEVKIYFEDKDYPEIEADKFFAHYLAVGWMVGKSPMQDWKAAARKWMLNDQKNMSNGGQRKLCPGKLDAGKGKDYNEPL